MASIVVKKPTIGTLPGYIKAVNAYKAPKAVIKAIAPTPQAKIALGPKFGSPLPAASQPIPNYMMPATPVTAPGTAQSVPRSAVPSNYLPNIDAITGHPLYQQALGAYNTNMQDLMRALQTSVGQSLIKSGYDPTAAFQKLLADRPDLGDFSGLLSQADIAAAAANPLSERALNEQAYNRGLLDQTYGLAARGMGASGEVATGTNQLLQNRQLAENQSRDALLQAITGGIGGYLTQKTQGFNDLQDVGANVAGILAQQDLGPYAQGDEDLTDVQNAQATEQLIPGTNVPSAASPPVGYVMWGGQQMKNAAQMKQWLAARGLSWNTWANQHPDAARKLLDLS